MTTTLDELENQYEHERRYLRKVLNRFRMKVNRQDGGRLHGLFEALLAFLLTNEQRVAHLEKENSALKAQIAKMVSITIIHFLLFFPQMELTNVFLFVKTNAKQEEGKTANGGEESSGDGVADVSLRALAFWGHGCLSRLVRHFKAQLLSRDGSFPVNNDWRVSDSCESSSSSDDTDA